MGTSPKDTRGGKRGASLGKGKDKPMSYTEKGDVMSHKDTNGGTVFRDSVMQTIKDITDKHRGLYEIVEKESIVEITKGDNAMAFWTDSGTFAFNEKYADSKKLNIAYDHDVKEGYHPSRGSKTADQAVTAHEFGHALTTLARKNQSMDFDAMSEKVIREATSSLKYTNAKSFASKISGYAKESNAECIAEAYADVYCNGSKASAESRAVVRVLEKYL